MYAQGYFSYDSKKSGGVTVSHLRFGKSPIKSTYLVNKANFVACHNPSYMDKYDIVEDLVPGGTFLLNCIWSGEELEANLPGKVKKYIADNNIKFYTINAIKIGKEIGLGSRVNTVLQAAFFKLSGVIPIEDAVKFMKDAATKSYSKKGEAIVKMNHDAIDAGVGAIVEVKVPEAWKNCTDDSKVHVATGNRPELVKFVNDILIPVNAQQGDKLPISTFMDNVDGTLPQGSAAYEKRGIAVDVPEWNFANCIQCNFCSMVCPHAVIRPVAMTEAEVAAAPAGTKATDMTGLPGMKFAMTVSTLDCTGCGSCVTVCPGKKGEKALTMKPIATQMKEQAVFDYALTLDEKPEVAAKFSDATVKGSQFKQPLLEFSGACAGCGETPYAKLMTQLFGDRAYIANATGCSSIWGGSAPSTPYTVNKKGYGPAWGNSLFEDNAEFGLGMNLAQKAIRDRLKEYVEKLAGCESAPASAKAAAEEYLATFDNSATNRAATDKLIAELEAMGTCGETVKKILADKDFLAKKSMWIFGGDGWAYDIGFGGLKKKDLAQIAMSYGYVYVAQCAMGADYNQTLKAFREAEAYNGPSLIICYAPCINHGIKGGMGISMTEEKKAVAAGYWHMFRFNPALADEGKNPFTLDSKAPSASYRDFIMGEVRYNALTRAFPERAAQLFEKAEKFAEEKYNHLVTLEKVYGEE